MRSRRRALGQHFLHDRGIIRKIIDSATLVEDERVVEIGAGPGVLTRALATLPIELSAIELDSRLYHRLRNDRDLSNRQPPVNLIHADALRFPFDSIKAPFVIIGNLPYSIATPLLFRLLECGRSINRMILMIQREVADRILAVPGTKAYGPLSVGIQYHAAPRLLFSVSPRSFKPPPRVLSAVIRLTPREKPPITVQDEAFFFKVVRAAFTHRRKSLRNALRATGLTAECIGRALEETALLRDNPGRRGETLSMAEWGRLADKLFECKTDS